MHSWTRQCHCWHVELDASPWGLGGILALDGKALRYFAVPLDSHDEEQFGHQIGTSTGQQCWEALALLVAVKIWKRFLLDPRNLWIIKSDSISTLVLATKLSVRSPAPQLIAKELALMMAETAAFPQEVHHVPGTLNVQPDALSRIFAPEPTEIPIAVRRLIRDSPPARPSTYYETLCAHTQVEKKRAQRQHRLQKQHKKQH
eukprot:6481823-Amphidinium_carterae.2